MSGRCGALLGTGEWKDLALSSGEKTPVVADDRGLWETFIACAFWEMLIVRSTSTIIFLHYTGGGRSGCIQLDYSRFSEITCCQL